MALLVLIACGAQLMVVLDGLIVNVALPDIRTSLGLSATQQQWIVTGYLISFGGFLLLASRASDYFGHRKVFMAGIAVFTMASFAGGLAQNAGILLAARFIQGLGAAVLAPGSLALLTLTFAGDLRARAISIWSATSASAGALGLVLGGVITSGLGWRWVLLVNVPIGVVLWTGSRRALQASPVVRSRRLDLLSAVLVTLSTGALTYGLSQVGDRGLGSLHVLVPLAFAPAALVCLVASQRRTSDPLIPLAIFRHSNLRLANLIIAVLGAVLTAVMYFLSLYEQGVLHYTPLTTGLSLLPMSVVLTIGALASKNLLQRFGPRPVIITGSLLMAIGLAWFTTIAEDSNFTTHILGPSLMWAAGASIIAMPCVAVATGNVDARDIGLASGLVNTARQTGGALGIAALVTVAAGQATAGSITVEGYRTALAAAAGMAILIAALAALLRNDPSRNADRDDRSEERPGST